MKNATKAEEQARVTAVIAKLKARLAAIHEQIEAAHRETSRIERAYGENTKVNVTEVDDQMETNAAVQQQKVMVARAVENETILKHEGDRLTLLADNPYFGRIDIDEDGEPDTLYIGTATFIDEDGDFLVYDWRAPISSIYYNGTLGDVTYETPAGEQHATLKNKRQFQIEHGHIKTMFDTNETVGDEILQSVLGDQSDEYMKNIVATIQREQNDIIRDTSSDLLVVQGVAGSGKTSAVLQRVAYLLYHSRSDLDADQMVLFSPNRLFANYISQVLPSLGEKNMRQATLFEFLANRFTGLHVETLFERYEHDAAGLPQAAETIRRFKEAPSYLQAIADYANDPDRVPHFIDVEFNGEVFFSATAIDNIYQSQPTLMKPIDKFTATKNALIKQLNARIHDEATHDWAQLRVSDLSQTELETLTADHEFETGEDEQQFVSEAIVAKAFAPIYDALYNDHFYDVFQDYQQFMEQVAAPVNVPIWQTMITAFSNGIEAHHLRLEDAAPLLYLRDLSTGSGQNSLIQYVFVDEMQDFSMAQLLYLKHAFPKAKLTLLGDAKQDVFTSNYQPSDFIHEIKDVFSGYKIRLITLNKSYRSTQPITNFAKALLPKHDHIQAFNRAGDMPEVLTVSSADATASLSRLVTRLLTVDSTVAILTKDAKTAAQLY
ncbi:ATP-dependent DNA helicase, partial [Lacticaseibacillus rhamnosus]